MLLLRRQLLMLNTNLVVGTISLSLVSDKEALVTATQYHPRHLLSTASALGHMISSAIALPQETIHTKILFFYRGHITFLHKSLAKTVWAI